MAAPWSCAVTPSWGPSKSSWSSNSSSICRRNHHHASPRQQRRFPSHPTPCSGDFRDAPVDLTHFFPPVEKVGLGRNRFVDKPHRKRTGKQENRIRSRSKIDPIRDSLGGRRIDRVIGLKQHIRFDEQAAVSRTRSVSKAVSVARPTRQRWSTRSARRSRDRR